MKKLDQGVVCMPVMAGKDTSAHLENAFRQLANDLGRNAEEKSEFFRTMMAGGTPDGVFNDAKGAGLPGFEMGRGFVHAVGDCLSGKDADGLPGVYLAMEQAALSLKVGSVTSDLSAIRPVAAVAGDDVNAYAGGPLKAMELFNALGESGAQTAMLRVDHPDILSFIDAKKLSLNMADLGMSREQACVFEGWLQDNSAMMSKFKQQLSRYQNLQTCVGLTDAFMEAVATDGTYELVHRHRPNELSEMIVRGGQRLHVWRTVRARDVFQRLMAACQDDAGPQVVFLDKVGLSNNLRYAETLVGAQTGGGQMLPSHGSTLTGRIDLGRFVVNAYSPNAFFDMEQLRATVRGLVPILDRLLDVAEFPLVEQRAEALNKRRIGIGVSGMDNAIAMLGLAYGMDESVSFAARVAQEVALQAYLQSVEEAKKHGPFPLFDAEYFLEDGTFASTLPATVKHMIRTHGLRNSHLLVSDCGGLITGDDGIDASALMRSVQMRFVRAISRFVDSGGGLKVHGGGSKNVNDMAMSCLAAWELGLVSISFGSRCRVGAGDVSSCAAFADAWGASDLVHPRTGLRMRPSA